MIRFLLLSLLALRGYADCVSACTAQAAGHDSQNCESSIVLDGECVCRCKYVTAAIDATIAACAEHALKAKVTINGEIMCLMCVTDAGTNICLPVEEGKPLGTVTVDEITCPDGVRKCSEVFKEYMTTTTSGSVRVIPSLTLLFAIKIISLY